MFDASGAHAGFIKVTRSSVDVEGRTTYFMDTALEVNGPLRARFEAKDFAFGVGGSERDRVYLGPDFVGAGQPWGSVVDAHYYSPAWQADLRTLVHILPDGKTQAYSSQLFEGPTLVAVFNGLYTMTTEYGKQPEQTRAVDQFIAAERTRGPAPHVLPFKDAGTWSGELVVCDDKQQPAGVVQARIAYRPLTLLRAGVEVQLTGAIERRWRYERARHGRLHTYDGPDIFGNAAGYGRALYLSQHVYGRAESLRGRELILDDQYSLSVVWNLEQSGRQTHLFVRRLALAAERPRATRPLLSGGLARRQGAQVVPNLAALDAGLAREHVDDRLLVLGREQIHRVLAMTFELRAVRYAERRQRPGARPVIEVADEEDGRDEERDRAPPAEGEVVQRRAREHFARARPAGAARPHAHPAHEQHAGVLPELNLRGGRRGATKFATIHERLQPQLALYTRNRPRSFVSWLTLADR